MLIFGAAQHLNGTRNTTRHLNNSTGMLNYTFLNTFLCVRCAYAAFADSVSRYGFSAFRL